MLFYCFSVVLQFTKMHLFISKINKEIIECVVVLFVRSCVCLFLSFFWSFLSFFPGCFHIF